MHRPWLGCIDLGLLAEVSHDLEMALATCRYERSPTIFIFGLVCIDLDLLAEVPHDFTVAWVNCRFDRSEAIFIVWPICTDLALFAKVAHDFDAAVAGCRYERNPTRMIFEVLRNIGVALTSCRLERSLGNLALVLFESILACLQRYRTPSTSTTSSCVGLDGQQ